MSARIRLLLADMRAGWAELDRRIKAFEEEFAASARQDEAARRLATVPGIGPINATALVAAVGDAGAFARARDLAAWLGLVSKQSTTGGRPKLLGITKRGSRYLRKNLIHGVRAVMPKLATADTRLGAWVRGLLARAHKNTTVEDNVHGGGGNSDAGREVGLRWPSDLAARVELRSSHP
jgi:transposase